MNPPEKKMTRHVYKTGAAGCGGKATPTSAKNGWSGKLLHCHLLLHFCLRLFAGVYLSCFQAFILGFNFRVCGNFLVLLNGNAQS
jgi:hypothetical protein